MVDTYLSAQLFAAHAVGQKRKTLAYMNKKNIEGKQLSILKSISNEIQENWDDTYIGGPPIKLSILFCPKHHF
jgi:hypothetical protein